MRAPTHEPGQGARRQCRVCGQPLSIKQRGRTRLFCSAVCWDEDRRNRNFRNFGTTVPHRSAVPENAKKTATKSTACKATSADRGSPIKPLSTGVLAASGVGVSTVVAPPADVDRQVRIRLALKTEFDARWSTTGLVLNRVRNPARRSDGGGAQ